MENKKHGQNQAGGKQMHCTKMHIFFAFVR